MFCKSTSSCGVSALFGEEGDGGGGKLTSEVELALFEGVEVGEGGGEEFGCEAHRGWYVLKCRMRRWL